MKDYKVVKLENGEETILKKSNNLKKLKKYVKKKKEKNIFIRRTKMGF